MAIHHVFYPYIFLFYTFYTQSSQTFRQKYHPVVQILQDVKTATKMQPGDTFRQEKLFHLASTSLMLKILDLFKGQCTTLQQLTNQ